MLRGWAACLVCVLPLACADQVLGPIPKLAGIAPNAACPSQNVTPITLTGTNLTPVVSGSLTDHPALTLPRISLIQVLTLTGASLTRTLVLPDEPSGDHVRWTSTKSLVFDVYPELGLQPGLYGIEVTDPDGLPGILTSGLVLVPPPQPAQVAPDLVGSQHDSPLAVAGAFLLGNGTDNPTLVISGGDAAPPVNLPAVDLQGCEPLLGGSGLSACLGMSSTLPAGSLPAGTYQLAVQNPAPVGCISTLPLTLTVGPEPTISSIQADLDCTSQSTQTLTITGSGFLSVAPRDGGASVTPTVQIASQQLISTPSDCVALSGPVGESVMTCQSLTVTLPQGVLNPGTYPVTVTNPDGDVSQEDAGYTEVPPPALATVTADLACDAQGDQVLVLAGAGFLTIGDTPPSIAVTVSLGGGGPDDGGASILATLTAVTASGCTPLEGLANEQAQSCTSLSGTLPAGTLGPGSYQVVVINPDAAACQSQQAVGLTVVPPPAVLSVSPDLACGVDSDSTLSVSGDGFIQVGATSPQVVLTGMGVGDGGLILSTQASVCAGITGLEDEAASACTLLTASLPAGQLPTGNYQLAVLNPSPADCISPSAVDLTITGAPSLTQVTPDLACAADGSRTLTLAGAGFLQIGAQVPGVSLVAADGTTRTTAGPAVSGCSPLGGPGEATSTCTQVTASVGSATPPGDYTVVVTNPGTAGCSSSASLNVTLLPAPILTSLSSDVVCTAQGAQTVVLQGSSLVTVGPTNPSATVGSATVVGSASGCTSLPNITGETAQSCTGLTVILPVTLDAGLQAVTVANPPPAGCVSAKALHLLDLPAPTLTSATPATACDSQGGTAIAFSGSGFATIAVDGGTLSPTVTLTASATNTSQTFPAVASQCAAVTGAAEAIQSCSKLTVSSAAALAPGSYQATITNPSPAACSSASLTVNLVPGAAPTLLSPDISTADQASTFTLLGDLFIQLSGATPTVQVSGGGLATALSLTSAVANCRTFPGAAGEQACQSLTFSVGAGALGAGTYQVAVQNPGSVACAATPSLALTVVSEPTLTNVASDLTCTAQGSRTLTLTGTGFLEVTGLADGGSLSPVVSLGNAQLGGTPSGCSAITGPVDETVQSCTSLAVTLPSGSPAAGTSPVSVANPFGGATAQSKDLTVVSAPSLKTLTPDLACDAQGNVVLTLSGAAITTVGTTGPQVTLTPSGGDGGLAFTGTASGCSAITGPTNESAQSCTSVAVTVKQSALAAGSYLVSVANPASVGCSSTQQVDLTDVVPPVLVSATPDLACDSQGETTLTLSGSGFLIAGSATPSVTLQSAGSGTTGATLTSTASNCTAINGPANETAQTCTQLSVTLAEGALVAGNYQVAVSNPAPAGCASAASIDFTVEPAPTLKTLSPDLACNADGSIAIALSGSNLLEVGGTLPSLSLAAVDGGEITALSGVAVGSCVSETGPSESVSACSQVSATIPAAQAPGAYAVMVTNPGANGCSASTASRLLLLGPPVVSAAAPDLACNADGSQTLVISGSGFITTNSSSGTASPTVKVGTTSVASAASNCTALAGLADESAQTCSQLTVTLPAGLATGLLSVVVSNPAAVGCSSSKPVTLLELPAPTLTSATPDLACPAQGTGTLVLSGAGFASVTSPSGTLNPQVALKGAAGTQTLTGTPSGCSPVTGASETVLTCTSLSLSLPAGMNAGLYQATVTNPAPASCSTLTSLTVDIAAPPSAASVTNGDVACLASGGLAVTVSGGGFLTDGSSSPTMILTPSAGAATVLAATVGGTCTSVSGLAEAVQSCTTVTATLPSGLAPGAYQLAVTNPGGGACSSTSLGEVVLPAPAISSVSPSQTCGASSGNSLTVSGTGFLQSGATLPTVALLGALADGGEIDLGASSAGGCTAISDLGGGPALQLCTSLTAALPLAVANALQGQIAVAVKDPAPDSCASAAPSCPGPDCLTAIAPPVVSGFSPSSFCASGGQVTLSGSNLQSGVLSILSGASVVATAPVTVLDGGSGNMAVAQLPALAAGSYQLQYAVGGSCAAEVDGGQLWTGVATVTGGPALLIAEVPVVYGGINTPVSFLVSGVATPIQSLHLVLASDAGIVDLTSSVQLSSSGTQLSAVIPAGTPSAVYGVALEDATACTASISSSELVSGSLQSTIASVVPSVGFQQAATGVTLTGTTHGTFQLLPQAWLSPSGGGPGALAIPLGSMSLDEPSDPSQPDSLSATVGPSTATAPMPLGGYDLFVANPDGVIDSLANAFSVSSQPGPQIASASPTSLPANTVQTLTLQGSGFANGSALQLQCVEAGALPDAGSTLVSATSVTASSGGAVLTGAISLGAGEVCAAQVTNPDGSSASFQSIASFGASGALASFAPGPAMVVARAAPQAAVGNATSSARFVYALGGNGGASPLTSIESAALSLSGLPSAFGLQPGALGGQGDGGFSTAADGGLVEALAPAPRERGTAVAVGRFLYLVGGTADGSTPLAEVDRAEILDPGDAPLIASSALAVDATGQGFSSPGALAYLVSAIFDSSYPNNPGGESLPSPAAGVQVCDASHAGGLFDCPAVSGQGLDVELSWSAVPHALGYRVYRTPSLNDPASAAVLLATVSPSSDPVTFIDRGAATISGQAPLQLGDLGAWATVGQLSVGRIAPAVTSAVDPGNPAVVYLYAFGGQGPGGALRSDYELIPLTLSTEASGAPLQQVGSSVLGSSPLVTPPGAGGVPLPEWMGQAASATAPSSPTVPSNQAYVFIGPGAIDTGATSGQTLDYGVLSAGAGGQLSALAALGASSNSVGYGLCVQAGSLAIFGGSPGPAPSTAFASALLASPPGTLAGPFASGGNALNVARVEMATAVSGGTLMVLGGWTSGPPESTATSRTELSSW